ncbi:MAG: helix-turn-helix domain-containing protein [Bacillota bacterium]
MVKQGFVNLPEEEQGKILEAALDEFSEKDYDAASLNQIISRAGISKGSMYHYFNNKEELFIYVLEEAMKKKKAFLTEVLNQSDKKLHKLDIFENLELQLHSAISFARKNYRYHQISINLQNMPECELKKRIWGRFREAFEEYMETMVEKAIFDGAIRSDLGKSFVIRILQFFLTRFTEIYPDYREMMQKDDSQVTREMSNLVGFLKNGLQGPKKREEE